MGRPFETDFPILLKENPYRELDKNLTESMTDPARVENVFDTKEKLARSWISAWLISCPTRRWGRGEKDNTESELVLKEQQKGRNKAHLDVLKF